MDDVSCEATCQCNSNWDGYDCSISHDAMMKKMDLREIMMSSLSKALDTVDDSGVLGVLANMQMMCQNPSELSLVASKMAIILTQQILQLSLDNNLPYESMLPTLDTLDNIQKAMTIRGGNTISSRRRLLLDNTTDTNAVFSSVRALATSLMNQMYEGQDPVTTTKGNLRISAAVATNNGSQVQVITPLTLMEQLADMKPFVVTIDGMVEPQPVKVLLLLLLLSLLLLLLLLLLSSLLDNNNISSC